MDVADTIEGPTNCWFCLIVGQEWSNMRGGGCIDDFPSKGNLGVALVGLMRKRLVIDTRMNMKRAHEVTIQFGSC